MEDKTIKRVVGLQYKPENGPPCVVLKSAGVGAEEVLEEAGSLLSGPVVVRDEKLLQQLYRLPLDAAIDPSLYELVAILLVQVYAADNAFLEADNVFSETDSVFSEADNVFSETDRAFLDKEKD